MTWDRILSLAIVVVYAALAGAFGPRAPGESLFGTFAGYLGLSVVPLGLIWFGEELGDYVGSTGRGSITRRTPGWLVKGFGWIALAVLVGLGTYLNATGVFPHR
jgi:membrane protease YdiL (CAAX protease family)